MADIGFTQYVVPQNIVLHQDITLESSQCLSQYPIENIKDDNLYSYCSLVSNRNTNPYIIIDFHKFYKINHIRCLFNNFINNVQVYDLSFNNTEDILLGELNTNERGITNFDIILNNRMISKIKITGFQTYFIDENIEIIEVEADMNEIIPPEGYHFKDIQIESQPLKYT